MTTFFQDFPGFSMTVGTLLDLKLRENLHSLKKNGTLLLHGNNVHEIDSLIV